MGGGARLEHAIATQGLALAIHFNRPCGWWVQRQPCRLLRQCGCSRSRHLLPLPFEDAAALQLGVLALPPCCTTACYDILFQCHGRRGGTLGQLRHVLKAWARRLQWSGGAIDEDLELRNGCGVLLTASQNAEDEAKVGTRAQADMQAHQSSFGDVLCVTILVFHSEARVMVKVSHAALEGA